MERKQTKKFKEMIEVKAGTKPEYVRDNANFKIYRVVPAPHLSKDGKPVYALKDIDGHAIYFVNDTGLNYFIWGTVVNA